MDTHLLLPLLPPPFLFRYPVVYLRPRWEATYVLVVDVAMSIYLAGIVSVEGKVLRVVGIDAVEGDALVEEPVQGGFEAFALSARP